MLDADRDKLQDKLIDLMVMRTSREEGAPYVREDGTFGLYCGDVMGGLYSAYHLIDGLKNGGLFSGPQAAGTDLDAASYTFSRDKVIAPFEGVRLFWNETGQMQVEVKTEKPLEAVLEALDKGTQKAKISVRQRFNEKVKWEDEMLRDSQRDRMPPVFGPAIDRAFFNAYVAYRFERDLGVTGITLAEEIPDAETQRLLKDSRPRQKCTFGVDKNSPLHPSEFNQKLRDVFTGKVAVTIFQHSPGFGELEMQFCGTPARLTADILDNDSAGARVAAQRITDEMTAPLYQKIMAEIDNRDSGSKTAQSLTAGTEGKMNAMKPPKFKHSQP